MDNLVQQLNKIYYEEEYWHADKLSELEITRYHSEMIAHGRLITITEDNELIAYFESWRLTFEQFGRIMCCLPFSALEEDVTVGPIAHLANVWIRKDKRRSRTIKQLHVAFLELNIDAEFYVGKAKRKKTGLVKVFNRKEFYDKIYKKRSK